MTTQHPPAVGPFATAMRPTPFPTLVLVGLGKLTATTMDRALLALAPVMLVGTTVLFYTGSTASATFATAPGQLIPTYFGLRLGHVLLHAILIKFIAEEWQYRCAQPTLLLQPSRIRYFLAQGAVVLVLWLVAAFLQTATTLLVAPRVLADLGMPYLLALHTGWVVGVCGLGSLLTMLVALTVAMVIPHVAWALAAYFVSVPVLLTVAGLAPRFFGWVDPAAPVTALADIAVVDGAGPVVVSLVVWTALLGFAGYQVVRRDLARV